MTILNEVFDSCLRFNCVRHIVNCHLGTSSDVIVNINEHMALAVVNEKNKYDVICLSFRKSMSRKDLESFVVVFNVGIVARKCQNGVL